MKTYSHRAMRRDRQMVRPLTNGSLDAFWVSRDESGRSDGYVAAGGPGYTGPTDTVGKTAPKADHRMGTQGTP